MVGDLVLGDAMGDFRVETSARTDNGDFGISVQEVKNATGGNLLMERRLVFFVGRYETA